MRITFQSLNMDEQLGRDNIGIKLHQTVHWKWGIVLDDSVIVAKENQEKKKWGFW
jgi:hypothetical protein